MTAIDFDSKFPDNRRDGETVLRQAQLVMLRMLKIIDYICREHGLRYWLCSGTLLGAVRHKGFIPWDDDLDISMPREDYEKFVKVAVAELPADIMLQTLETDPHYRYLPLPCKVRDKNSFILSTGFEDEDCEKGLFVDIFPVDRYHLNPIAFRCERWIKTYNTFICKCLDSVHFARESRIRRFLSYFHPVFNVMVKQYMRFAKKIIERNKRLGVDCYIGAGFDTLWERYYRYDDIYPLIEIAFEDGCFYAPQSTDTYLRTIYGPDYMTPLPESKRIPHASVIKPVL